MFFRGEILVLTMTPTYQSLVLRYGAGYAGYRLDFNVTACCSFDLLTNIPTKNPTNYRIL